MSSIVDGYLAGGEGIVTDYARAELTARHIKAKLGWLEADALRPSHSATYARQRREEGIGGGTIRRELTTLRAALRWAQGERLIAAAPSVRLPPRPAPRDRWLTRDEADRLLGSCVSHHVQLFVLVALHTAAGAIRLWLLAPRLRGYAGLVVAAVGDAGARDVMFTTKDAYHAVIEPNGLGGQVLAAAKGGTA